MNKVPDDNPLNVSLQQFEDVSSVLSYLTASQSQRSIWFSILENSYNHLSLVASADECIKEKILLPKLLTKDFDNEQIWQQIELLNDILIKNIASEINKKLAEKATVANSVKRDPLLAEKMTIAQNENEQHDGTGNESDIDEELDSSNERMPKEDPNLDWEDMDKFCEQVERQAENQSSEESGDEMQTNIFIGDDEELNQSEDEGEIESRLEKELKKMRTKISANEEQSLETKSWKMLGEASTKDRESNTLLEEHLQFDHGARAAPEITMETSTKIEKLIIERIKIKLFDDVERKEKPVGKDKMKQKELPLNHEKSKMSLAEIYEKDYLDACDQATGSDRVEEINEAEESIKIDLEHLFRKLDALSNFNYTPKGVKDEIKVVVNAPAISLEEAMPAAVSDRQILAPAEIKSKQKEELRSAVEEDKTDKKRKKRKIKKSQSIKSHEQKLKKLKLDRDSGSKKVKSKKDAISLVSEEVKQGISLAKKSSEKVNSNFFSKLQDSINQKESIGGSSYKSKVKKKQKFNKFG